MDCKKYHYRNFATLGRIFQTLSGGLLNNFFPWNNFFLHFVFQTYWFRLQAEQVNNTHHPEFAQIYIW